MTRQTYYNADDTKAKTCRDDDRQVELKTTYNFQVDRTPIATELAVTEANGFPAQAHGLNLQLTGAEMTMLTDTLSTAAKTYQICEGTDWAKNTTKSILSKDNCILNPFSLTDYNTSAYFASTWATDGEFRSAFVAGDTVYSIYKVTADSTPQSLQIGNLFQPLEGGTYESDADAKTARIKDGSTEFLRHANFSETFSLN